MRSVLIKFISLSLLVALVSACGGKEGANFEGKWEGGTEKAPLALDIKYSDGMYHVDHTYKTIFMSKPAISKFEGVGRSSEVLEISQGFGNLNMRLEDGFLYFDNQKYHRVK